MKLRACVICSTRFVQKSNTTGKYCSRYCAWQGRGGAKFNARVARKSASKRGDAQRDRGTRSYRKLNGRHEHRQVAEQALGRKLRKGEIVHHKDGNKRNNAPGNLEVMTQAQHMREHGMGIPGKPLAHRPWEYRK